MTETKTAEKTVHVPALAGAVDVERLEREVGKLEGVVAVEVADDLQRVRIEWTEATIDWPAIAFFLEEIGYSPAGEGAG